MKNLVEKHATLLRVLLLAAAAIIVMASCGGSGEDGNLPALTPHLDFERNTAPADGSFKAIIWLSDAGGATVAFASTPTITSTRGTVSALTPRGDGKQEATVTPDVQKSGEYRVTLSATVSGSSVSVSHTAIVMEQVASGWGQPFSVDGLVNTGGTQDSLAVSPDGQYLFLQYYPVTLSCILAHIIASSDPNDPNDLYCQTPLGPVTAPQRPNMPGASRVGTNSVTHNCPALNFYPTTIPLPPIAVYGFHLQADGSYAEPFVFMFTNNDGCFAPWGPSVKANGDGTYRMFTAFNDPRETAPNNFAHIYDFSFTPGTTQTLGETSYSSGVQIGNFVLNKAAIAGTDGHRGNPHVYYSGNTPSLLFYDEETQPSASQFIHVASWNGTSWNEPITLNFPTLFNTTGNGDTQPYFDGTQLILRNGLELRSYAYNGGALDSAASWSTPVPLLVPSASAIAGNVIVVGEPTIATINGIQVLYFVYGIYQANGSVNIRAGFVRKGS
ncbi:MAG: hypothetical protein KJ681_09530 [Gammaproteobacteria bacterium]|nr:hypothetical protein [Gammaproteobacteria bacterium]